MGVVLNKWMAHYSVFCDKLGESFDSGSIDTSLKPILLSSCCVADRAMMDIDDYFNKNDCSRESLVYLIRNIDFVVGCIIALNENLGFTKVDPNISKLKQSFDLNDHKIIEDFRTLRSMVVAHPVDTHFKNDKGERSIVYLEDIYPMRNADFFRLFPSYDNVSNNDYLLQKGDPNSKECRSFYEPLLIDRDIKPVIEALYRGLDRLTSRLDDLSMDILF